MRVINIVEVVDNVVLGIESFAVVEEQLSDDVIEKAEEFFAKKAIENGCNENDIDSFIEDGSYYNDDYSLSIVWSYIEGI